VDVWVPGNLTEVRATSVSELRALLSIETGISTAVTSRILRFFPARFICAFYTNMILAINDCFPQHCFLVVLGYLGVMGYELYFIVFVQGAAFNVTHFESRIIHLLYTAINTTEHG
jgi:hypothetical protein